MIVRKRDKVRVAGVHKFDSNYGEHYAKPDLDAEVFQIEKKSSEFTTNRRGKVSVGTSYDFTSTKLFFARGKKETVNSLFFPFSLYTAKHNFVCPYSKGLVIQSFKPECAFP